MVSTGIHFTKTRIAPTPSGYLHLGNACSFAITAALAVRHGARILLRIDDLDRERVQKAYVEDIFDTLRFLDIPWQEGPESYEEYEHKYSQRHRLEHYRAALEQLKTSGALFACNCSRAQVLQQHPEGIYTGTCLSRHLPFDTGNVSWRLDTRDKLPLVLKDINGNSTDTTLPVSMQYFVVRKKDAYPAYQLASLADDLYFGVDLVVRGADLWDSTLAQLYLAQKLGTDDFAHTVFYHHPLLKDGQNQKLSKSEGATSIQYLRRQGMSAAEVYALIGKIAGLQEPVRHWKDLAALP